MKPDRREVAESIRSHDGLIARRQALALGLSAAQIQGYLDRGTWERVHREVYRATSAPRTDRQLLRAACWGAGDRAVASHASAAWLWDLRDRAPARPEITVPTSWAPDLKGVRVHRSRDLGRARTTVRTGIPVTDPVRTLVDCGGVMAGPELSDLLDRGLALRLVTLRSVLAELRRLSRPGRPGPARVRDVIAERGMTGAPHPSVLESRMLRIFLRHRLPVPAVEIVAGPDGEYRLDFAYPPVKLAIEVDGYVWHFTPEHQHRDHQRRNRPPGHRLAHPGLHLARRHPPAPPRGRADSSGPRQA